MLWLILSLATALAVATQDAWVKKFFSQHGHYDMVGYPAFYSLPLFLVAVILAPRPPLDAAYFASLAASLPLNGISFLIYMRAIQVSPLSLTLPYLAFTPVFMIVTGVLVLDEVPGTWGILGILTTCVGSYVLNLNPNRRRLLDPFRAVFHETGSWLMLVVAFVFSLAAVVGKKGILHSSPLYFTMTFFAVLDVCFLVFLQAAGKISLRSYTAEPVKGAVAGMLLFLHAFFHGYAIAATKAAYMISIKRFSILFGVLYGGVLFHEKDIGFRLLGAALMLSGAVLIVLKGA